MERTKNLIYQPTCSYVIYSLCVEVVVCVYSHRFSFFSLFSLRRILHVLCSVHKAAALMKMIYCCPLHVTNRTKKECLNFFGFFFGCCFFIIFLFSTLARCQFITCSTDGHSYSTSKKRRESLISHVLLFSFILLHPRPLFHCVFRSTPTLLHPLSAV